LIDLIKHRFKSNCRRLINPAKTMFETTVVVGGFFLKQFQSKIGYLTKLCTL